MDIIYTSLEELGNKLGLDSSSYVVDIIHAKLANVGIGLDASDVLHAVDILNNVMEYASTDNVATQVNLTLIINHKICMSV